VRCDCERQKDGRRATTGNGPKSSGEAKASAAVPLIYVIWIWLFKLEEQEIRLCCSESLVSNEPRDSRQGPIAWLEDEILGGVRVNGEIFLLKSFGTNFLSSASTT